MRLYPLVEPPRQDRLDWVYETFATSHDDGSSAAGATAPP